MTKISFVILHYNNIDDTLNCIGSIDNLKHNNIDVNIVLVDNCSPNGSGKTLEEKYQDRKDIKVILLDKNYGFSYGNNIGYCEALKTNPNSIMVINNDIIFEDANFLVNYVDLIKKNDYDVIGPDIINLKDQHQNPLSSKPTTLFNAYKNIFKERLYSLLFLIPVLNKKIYSIKKRKEEKWYDSYYEQKEKEIFDIHNFIPFGAFIIYSNNWLKNETIAFPSKTFMYEEEEILYQYIQKKKYTMMYYDKISVRHLVGRSTSKRTNNQIKNAIFQSKNKANALKEYVKILKNME